MKKVFFTVFLVALLIAVPGLGFAQTIVNVVSDLTGGTEGNLNKAIQAAITANKLSTTLFKLEAYGYYISTGTIGRTNTEHRRGHPGNDTGERSSADRLDGEWQP
jgi:uncharacterized membrane protein YjjB (DUF3815 family)